MSNMYDTVSSICGMRSLREDGIFSNISNFFLYIISFSFLHPSPRVQVFPSHPQASPPVLVGFGEHRVVGHQRCFQLFFSHLLQAEVCKDASPWGIGNGNGVLCVFLGTQNRTQKKLRLTLTVLMLSGEFFWGCLSKAIPKKSVVPLEVGFFLLWQGGW